MKKSKSEKHPHLTDKKALSIHPILKNSLGYCLAKAAMRSRHMMDTALTPYGIMTYQFAILYLLKRSGPLSQVEIGNEMCIDKASMVRFLDGLEKLSFITRAAGKTDRRIKTVAITVKGIKMSDKGENIRTEVQREFLSPLTEAEKKAYAEIIPKLIR